MSSEKDPLIEAAIRISRIGAIRAILENENQKWLLTAHENLFAFFGMKSLEDFSKAIEERAQLAMFLGIAKQTKIGGEVIEARYEKREIRNLFHFKLVEMVLDSIKELASITAQDIANLPNDAERLEDLQRWLSVVKKVCASIVGSAQTRRNPEDVAA